MIHCLSCECRLVVAERVALPSASVLFRSSWPSRLVLWLNLTARIKPLKYCYDTLTYSIKLLKITPIRIKYQTAAQIYRWLIVR